MWCLSFKFLCTSEMAVYLCGWQTGFLWAIVCLARPNSWGKLLEVTHRFFAFNKNSSQPRCWLKPGHQGSAVYAEQLPAPLTCPPWLDAFSDGRKLWGPRVSHWEAIGLGRDKTSHGFFLERLLQTVLFKEQGSVPLGDPSVHPTALHCPWETS